MSELAFSAVSPFDAIRRTRDDGTEYWSARDLMAAMQYDQWRNFETAIHRARASATNTGYEAEHHIAGASKMVGVGSGASRAVDDWHLTRFGAYLVVMNGDPRKPEVAAAQAYFAIKTREAETATPVPALTGPALMAAALIEAQATLTAQTERIAELEPKAQYVDRFVGTEDLRTVRHVANSLNIPEGSLRALLIGSKWIYAENCTRWSEKKQELTRITRYSAYAEKRDYFRHVPNHEAPRFKGEVMHTLKITPAGATAIARLAERNSLIDRQAAIASLGVAS